MRHLTAITIAIGLAGSVAGSAEESKPVGVSQAILDARTYAESGHYLGEDKIMGGKFALKGENPWQVALVLPGLPESPRYLFCGGTAVGKNVVMTAAHCVDDGTPPGALDVIVGATKLSTEGKRVKVQGIWIDPLYVKGPPHIHDVAILRLNEDVSAMAPPIELPIAEDDAALEEKLPVRVTGWGAPAKGGVAVRDLRTVDLIIISTPRCNQKVSYNGVIKPSMVCAGWKDGGRDACQGDSGGPLTAMVRGKRRLLGIVSWGRDCDVVDKFGVYARLPVLDWALTCAADQTKCFVNQGS